MAPDKSQQLRRKWDKRQSLAVAEDGGGKSLCPGKGTLPGHPQPQHPADIALSVLILLQVSVFGPPQSLYSKFIFQQSQIKCLLPLLTKEGHTYCSPKPLPPWRIHCVLLVDKRLTSFPFQAINDLL